MVNLLRYWTLYFSWSNSVHQPELDVPCKGKEGKKHFPG